MTDMEDRVNRLVSMFETPEQQRDALLSALIPLTLDKVGIMPHRRWGDEDVALIVKEADYRHAADVALAIQRLKK